MRGKSGKTVIFSNLKECTESVPLKKNLTDFLATVKEKLEYMSKELEPLIAESEVLDNSDEVDSIDIRLQNKILLSPTMSKAELADILSSDDRYTEVLGKAAKILPNFLSNNEF